MEESGIIHPDSFKSTIIELVNDHHVLMEQAIAAIGSGTVFTGGDDAESCDLGQFLLTFKTDNPVLLRVLKEVPKYHDAFHEGISEVQDALSRGIGIRLLPSTRIKWFEMQQGYLSCLIRCLARLIESSSFTMR